MDCPVCLVEGDSAELVECPMCRKALLCETCGACMKCGPIERRKDLALMSAKRAVNRASPDIDPEWGHNKPTGGLRYADLTVPVRRVVKISGREYIVSLLPHTHEIEFRQRRKRVRYRYTLEGVLQAAAREYADEQKRLLQQAKREAAKHA